MAKPMKTLELHHAMTRNIPRVNCIFSIYTRVFRQVCLPSKYYLVILVFIQNKNPIQIKIKKTESPKSTKSVQFSNCVLFGCVSP